MFREAVQGAERQRRDVLMYSYVSVAVDRGA